MPAAVPEAVTAAVAAAMSDLPNAAVTVAASGAVIARLPGGVSFFVTVMPA